MGFIADLRFLLRRLPPYNQAAIDAVLGDVVIRRHGTGPTSTMNDRRSSHGQPRAGDGASNVEHLLYHVGSHEKLPILLGAVSA